MRLTCSQKELATALMITSKAVDFNNTLPILNNVLLKAEGKKLYFTTTNLEIAISYWIDADIKNEGEITIPSKLLTNYINYLKDEKVELFIEEGTSLTVKSSDSVTKIKGLPSVDFPPIPAVEKEGTVVVRASDLKKAINQVVFAASVNTTRPILAGVYCVVTKDSLKMVATDSYRLAEKTIPLKKTTGNVNCIIPAKTIMDVGFILDNVRGDADIEMVISKNQVLFILNEIKITSRLIDGQFPNYEQIIPKSSKTKVYFNINSLSLILKRVNIFAKENNNKIIFNISKNSVKITTDTTQSGEEQVEINPKVEGENNGVALNSQYMLDVLASLEGQEAIFEIGDKINPTIIRPLTNTDYTHIIMPLKI